MRNSRSIANRNFTTVSMDMIQWERFEQQHYTPKEFALARMMEVAKLELARIEDAKENGYEIGLTKKYIDAFKKLNNELVERFNDLGGDAHSNYMETDPKYQD